jgi:hypothetical protein
MVELALLYQCNGGSNTDPPSEEGKIKLGIKILFPRFFMLAAPLQTRLAAELGKVKL